MKRFAVLFIVLMVSTMAPAAEMVIPTLSEAQLIYWGPEQNVVETEFNGPVACVADWDGDGIKDMLVGVYQEGAVYFYPNTGTNASPVFDERQRLTADGSDISFSPY